MGKLYVLQVSLKPEGPMYFADAAYDIDYLDIEARNFAGQLHPPMIFSRKTGDFRQWEHPDTKMGDCMLASIQEVSGAHMNELLRRAKHAAWMRKSGYLT